MTAHDDVPEIDPQPRSAPAALGTAGAWDWTEKEVLSADGRSLFRTVVDEVLHNPTGVVGLVLIVVIGVLCALAPLIARYDPNAIPLNLTSNVINAVPSGSHWLGTDSLGRDLWSRLLWGGRASLPAGLEIVGFAFVVGVPLGIIAGFGGRLVEETIMRFIDLLLAIPGLLLAIAIIGILGPSLKSLVIALGIASVPGFARVARASTLRLKDTEYVDAARAAGAGTPHILFRHILPNVLDPLVILATLSLSGALLAAAALSFLGVGTQLPDADWGTLLSNGFQTMFQSETELIFPAIFIVAAVLGVNLVGDALGDALNPRSRRR